METKQADTTTQEDTKHDANNVFCNCIVCQVLRQQRDDRATATYKTRFCWRCFLYGFIRDATNIIGTSLQVVGIALLTSLCVFVLTALVYYSLRILVTLP